jgi:putative flippase GtrA
LRAYALAYAFGLITGYLINSIWTFGRGQPRTLRQFVGYVAIHAVVLGISSAVLEVEVSVLGWPAALAAIPNAGLNATLGYVLLRRFVFRG